MDLAYILGDLSKFIKWAFQMRKGVIEFLLWKRKRITFFRKRRGTVNILLF